MTKDAGDPVCYVAPADGGEDSDMQNLKFYLSGMKRITSTVRFRDAIFMRRVLSLSYLIFFFLIILPD